MSWRTVRWTALAAVAVLLLLWSVWSGGIRLAAAPGPARTPGTPGIPGTPGPTPVVSNGSLVMPLPTDHLRRIRLLPKAPDADAEHLHWSLRATHDHGRRLALQITLSCGKRITGASVTETPNRLTVTVYGPPPGRYCALSLVIVFRSVRLPHPLGARTLVHG